MSDLRKVMPGESLQIPASAYNAFVDAAADHRNRMTGLERHPGLSTAPGGIVMVRNTSGSDRARFDVMGIEGPVILPADNLVEFINRVALDCDLPGEDHRDTFVVLMDPLPSGAMGRAWASGVCPVRIDMAGGSALRYAAGIEGVSTHLAARRRGAAAILWREGSSGVQWAVIRLGTPVPLHVIPVELQQTGGDQGDEDNPATWTYEVKDAMTGEILAADVDPVDAPHMWRRPDIGWMEPATFGHAHFRDDTYGGDELVIGWINETPGQEACDTYEGGSGE